MIFIIVINIVIVINVIVAIIILIIVIFTGLILKIYYYECIYVFIIWLSG